MVQQVATTKLDIAAPSDTSLNAGVQNNDGGGYAFSSQLADVQAGNNSAVVRSDNLSARSISEPSSIQAPREDNIAIVEQTVVNEAAEENAGQEIDQDLLEFLQQLDQANGDYKQSDPTIDSARRQFNEALGRLNGESQAEQVTLQRVPSEELGVGFRESANLDLDALKKELSDEDRQILEARQKDEETRIQFPFVDGTVDLTLIEGSSIEEENLSVSSVVLTNRTGNAEEVSENSDGILNTAEEQASSNDEDVDIRQFERVTLHQPVIGNPLVQGADNEPASARPLVGENNVAERDVENNVERSNEIVVQNLLQLNPEQQENAFNQIGALAGLNAAEKASKEFVAGLKAGFEDIKARYQAGQDVSNDLIQLVDQVSENLQESGQLNEQQLTQLTQTVGQLGQAFSTQGDGSFQSLLSRAEGRVGAASTNVEQLEASRTAQQNSVFDRAVNLAKPEAAVQLAEKVAFAVNARNLVADIRLDPADLGGIQARVSLEGEQATVNFVTQSQQARDLLEQQTPKLRELLDEQGIQLGQSSVQQESQQTQDSDNRQDFASNNVNGRSFNEQGSDESIEEIAESAITNGHVGAIDYFV
jgi:flagellar hook-length control protein FliK